MKTRTPPNLPLSGEEQNKKKNKGERRGEQLIIQKITGLSKEQLFLNIDIPKEAKKDIDTAMQRYKSGEPIEYIIENAEFYGYDFFVDKRVLIPRNETELMVEKVIETNSPPTPLLKGEGSYNLIDIGTGSGCIGISLLKEKNNIDKCYLVDNSTQALEVASINVQNHQLQNKIKIIESDLLEYFLGEKETHIGQNIIITANLPYIKDHDFDNVDKETREFEPATALYGGKKTGFELYEKLIQQCGKLAKQGKSIILFIEIGFDQYKVSKNYLKNLGLKYEYYKDNGGIERCVRIIIDN